MCRKEKIRFLSGEDEDTTVGRKDDFRKGTKDGIWKTRDSTYATRLFQLQRPPVASNAPFPGLLEDALEESLADARSISRPQFPRHLVMSIHTIVHIRSSRVLLLATESSTAQFISNGIDDLVDARTCPTHGCVDLIS